jgi:hypothetical protein
LDDPSIGNLVFPVKVNRRVFLGAGLLAAGRAALGSAAAPAPAPRPPLLIGYGVVNLWHTIDPEGLAGLLSTAGCTLTEIEYVAWFNESARQGLSSETQVKAARRLVSAMRRQQITTLISLVNWNGEAQRRQSDAWFQERVREISEQIGPERVILLGVSEPDGQEDGKAHRWMSYALEQWKGLKAACGDGGRGAPRVKGFDYVDWHHCEDFTEATVRLQTAGAPTINNTDCGPVINPGPARAGAMARIAMKKGAHCLIYGFKDRAIDKTVINALGDEIARSATIRPTRPAKEQP